MLAARVLGTRFHDENPRMSSMREKKRSGKEGKEGERRRAAVFLRYLTPLRFYGMHGMVQPDHFTNLLNRFMHEERLGCEISLKDRLNEITRLALALLENIGDEKSANYR